MTPRAPQTPLALAFRQTTDAVLRWVPIMGAVSIVLWPKQAPVLVFGLLGVCMAVCAACALMPRAGRGPRA